MFDSLSTSKGLSIMNELLKHISNDDLPSLFRSEASERTVYNELTRFVYMMFRRALTEGADKIQVTTRSLIWSYDGKVINKVDLDPLSTPEHPRSYASQTRKIIEHDPIVKKWTRVVSDSDESIVCEFLS